MEQLDMRLSTQIESLASGESDFSPLAAWQAMADHDRAATGKKARSSQARFDPLQAEQPIRIRGVEVDHGRATFRYGHGDDRTRSVSIYRDKDGKLVEEVRSQHTFGGVGLMMPQRPGRRNFSERETFDTGSGTAVVTREESGDTASISIRNRDGKEMATVRFAPGHDGEVRDRDGRRIVSRLVPERYGDDGKPVTYQRVNIAVGFPLL
jgi:hypothetical protein